MTHTHTLTHEGRNFTAHSARALFKPAGPSTNLPARSPVRGHVQVNNDSAFGVPELECDPGKVSVLDSLQLKLNRTGHIRP